MLTLSWQLVSICCQRAADVRIVGAFRYVGIVHPLLAHTLTSRRRIRNIIAAVWLTACVAALPVALFNDVTDAGTVSLCVTVFPCATVETACRLAEFLLFYLLPVLVQTWLYSQLSVKLFRSATRLQRSDASVCQQLARRHTAAASSCRAARSRKGVIKMLMVTVLVYVASYAPAQVSMLYQLVTHAPLSQSFAFTVFMITLAYVNSAVNPLIYVTFNRRFRARFRQMLCQRVLVIRQVPVKASSMESVLKTTLSSAVVARYRMKKAVSAPTIAKLGQVPLEIL